MKANKELTKMVENYKKMESSIVQQLFFQVEHGTTIGGFRERIWMDLFEGIIPKKFTIEQSVFIIDSNENLSKEVDLAIYDTQYTPYIFRFGKLKFIPIEAVAAVVECKSSSPSTKELEEWSEAIDKLATSKKAIVRIQGKIIDDISKRTDQPLPSETKKETPKETQTATTPIKILCTVKSDGKNQLENFDFVISALENSLEVYYDEDRTLAGWYEKLNHHKIQGAEKTQKKIVEYDYTEEYSKKTLNEFIVKRGDCKYNILSLNLMLNQLLMLINNPLFFPHLSYVKLFNDFEESEVAKKDKSN
jgi:hypothetical protein